MCFIIFLFSLIIFPFWRFFVFHFLFKTFLKIIFIYLCFWPCCAVCRILGPQPGIKPTPPALEAWNLNHWTTREVPVFIFNINNNMKVTQSCLFVTPWTVAHLAPLSMGFSRQESGVGCHALLQGIFLTQGLNLHLLCLALAGRFFTI